uniref:Uncharacterized protein n=1 Tax=Anopheles farauti TaxID=69004 RepID=A0A182Q3A2_9DIPT
MPSCQQHSHRTEVLRQRRTMEKPRAANLLLLLALGCLCGALSGGGVVSASAIPTASFPANGNGLANSASADVGHRRTSCLAVHPILKQRGVDQLDMPIDPIPGCPLTVSNRPASTLNCPIVLVLAG